MDWTSIDLVYSLVYPQILDAHKQRSDEAQAATRERGRELAQTWLVVMDQNFPAFGSNYLCGDAISLADCHAAT